MTDQPKSECNFFREELDSMIRTRYGNMTCYETIGVLEYVKQGLINGMKKQPEQQP